MCVCVLSVYSKGARLNFAGTFLYLFNTQRHTNTLPIILCSTPPPHALISPARCQLIRGGGEARTHGQWEGGWQVGHVT